MDKRILELRQQIDSLDEEKLMRKLIQKTNSSSI